MRDLWNSVVSGEFIYFGGTKPPSVLSTCPVAESEGLVVPGKMRPENPTTRPALSAIGNMMRLRNLSLTPPRSLCLATPASSNSALLEILLRCVVQARRIEDRRRLQKLKKPVALVLFFFVRASTARVFIDNFYAGFLREDFERPFEIQSFYFLDERENIAADIASETVIRAALRRNEKRGRPLGVERTPRTQARTASFQLHVLTHYVNN